MQGLALHFLLNQEKDMPDTKQQLYLLCADYIKAREAEIRKTIEDAREAANNETKSSAGDKYETGRETMQQEIDLNLTRLNELKKHKQTLDRIMPAHVSETVMPGSAVITDNGNYYIAISAGKLNVAGTEYYGISIASPIGVKLVGLKAGDVFSLNDRKVKVSKVL
jgi:transcription elongation GreA/GreB family factor